MVLGLTRGRGADLVVEASGAAPGIALGLQLVRKLGRVTAIGLTARPEITFPYAAGMFKSATYVFNLSTSYTSWDTAIGLVAGGRIQVAPFVTHRGGIDRWQEFFTALDEKKGLKGLFIF
jgi:L-iditol 2-dehydrogenase